MWTIRREVSEVTTSEPSNPSHPNHPSSLTGFCLPPLLAAGNYFIYLLVYRLTVWLRHQKLRSLKSGTHNAPSPLLLYPTSRNYAVHLE